MSKIVITVTRSCPKTVNVTLGPVFETFIGELLETGLYQSQSEVVREALRLLKEREELKRVELSELRKQVAVGAAQAGRD
jgi:antitoxin ParD1/3/4